MAAQRVSVGGALPSWLPLPLLASLQLLLLLHHLAAAQEAEACAGERVL
jgi:hypothetical protein